MTASLQIKSPGLTTDLTLSKLVPDPLYEPGGASLLIWDAANAGSFNPAGLANGQALPNLVPGGPAGSVLFPTAGKLQVVTNVATGAVKGIQKRDNDNLNGLQFDTGTQYFQTNLGGDFYEMHWSTMPDFALTLAAMYATDVSTPYALHDVVTVTTDSGTPANNGNWEKTGVGNGAGNWTQLNTATSSTGVWGFRRMDGVINAGRGFYSTIQNGQATALRLEAKFSEDGGNSNYSNTNLAAAGTFKGRHQVGVAKIGSVVYGIHNGVVFGPGAAITTPLTARNIPMTFGIQLGSGATAITGHIMSRVNIKDLTIAAAAAGMTTLAKLQADAAAEYNWVVSTGRFG